MSQDSTILSSAPTPGLGSRALAWLRTALIEGLLHCACAHQAVHPDLLDCIEGHRALRASSRSDAEA